MLKNVSIVVVVRSRPPCVRHVVPLCVHDGSCQYVSILAPCAPLWFHDGCASMCPYWLLLMFTSFARLAAACLYSPFSLCPGSCLRSARTNALHVGLGLTFCPVLLCLVPRPGSAWLAPWRRLLRCCASSVVVALAAVAGSALLGRAVLVAAVLPVVVVVAAVVRRLCLAGGVALAAVLSAVAAARGLAGGSCAGLVGCLPPSAISA